MLKLIAISGDGIGAGKTTLASQLAPGHVKSLAAKMRQELTDLLPAYEWFNKTQAYKENTYVAEMGGATVREVLIRYGQDKCAVDPAYWVKALATELAPLAGVYAIDDVRKLVEIEYLRTAFPGAVTHIHIAHPAATAEPQYQGPGLALRADYTIFRGTKK